MRKGIAVSPGVTVGTAYCIHEIFVNPSTKRLAQGEVARELARYEDARVRSLKDVRALRRKVESQVGKDEGAIFAVHESILQDATFTEKIRKWITEDRLNPQAALQQLVVEYAELFAKADDFMRDRLNDIRDVAERLSAHLSDVIQNEQQPLDGPLIVIANELLPSQVVALGDIEVNGIVTQAGSQTSHAAIIARSRGIPAVSGVPNILKQVKTGDTVVVDGREGHVILRPDAETVAAYRKLEREFADLQNQLAENRDHPAVAADNTPLELFANINSISDATAACRMGAGGVGLFRTEYLFLTHPDVPDEDEQYDYYRQVIAASPERKVTIRTLDIGGDKTMPYLGQRQKEANPFMGWRSLRLSFEHPEFFMKQLKAILRAASEANAAGGNVRMMFPMITTLEEIRRVRSMVRKAEESLPTAARGTVPVGMMLEVPAAAVMIKTMAPAVDFVSIGSNDLIQYLMAADRDNPKVSNLCQPLAPAVIHVLLDVINTCKTAGVPITLCGEMAGQSRAFLMLFGMGLRSFSMSPAFIPTIKQLAKLVSRERAEKIVRRALSLKTTNSVKRFLSEELNKLAPNLALLDMV